MTKLMYEYYILEFHPDHERAEGEGWVPQQYVVMEEHLGRSLFPDEDVKHLNGNHHDNRIDNLKIVKTQYGVTSSILNTSSMNKNLSKTFMPCRFQKPCWLTIRAPLARKNKVYLPYICDYQSSGDVLKCQRYWTFIENEAREGVENIDEVPTEGP